MILKTFELEKKNIKIKNFFLFYGENQGLKNEIIEKKFKTQYPGKVFNYEENEILNNKEVFFENILTKSFFENEKLIIINRATDKFESIAVEIIEKKIEDLLLIVNANNLEKKSKLRSFFEKNKETVCVPFYEDNNQTLQSLASKFFKENKLPISPQAINIIVERCRGDRQNLKNELEKIKNFIKDKKKIEIEDLLKLTNLAENYNVSELIDSCLCKNKKKTINILNENNFSLEDCILITRTFLIKSKRLLKLCKELTDKNSADTVISSFKPPIFWKDKEIVKQQMHIWNYKSTENLIYKINEIELIIKKNSYNSVNILSDFIIEQSSVTNN